MENFGKFCFGIVMLIMTLFIDGFVVLKLYDWFVVATFNSPQINIFQAIGLSLLVTYLMPKKKTDKTQTMTDVFIEELPKAIILAIIVLAMGYIIQLFA